MNNSELTPQRPTPPNEWLYKDIDNGDRWFTPIAYLGKNDRPWNECTDAEKRKWEEDHPEPEPEPEQ